LATKHATSHDEPWSAMAIHGSSCRVAGFRSLRPRTRIACLPQHNRVATHARQSQHTAYQRRAPRTRTYCAQPGWHEGAQLAPQSELHEKHQTAHELESRGQHGHSRTSHTKAHNTHIHPAHCVQIVPGASNVPREVADLCIAWWGLKKMGHLKIFHPRPEKT